MKRFLSIVLRFIALVAFPSDLREFVTTKNKRLTKPSKCRYFWLGCYS